jgi:UDP-N-acetylmuramoyl-L-alanyl-D-glutamate--2,6-diaminopimelate ligase
MKIKQVLDGVEIKKIIGSKDVNITGISNDSRRVFPGNVFIARRGQKFDATQFIEDAISSGAKVIISDLYNPFLRKDITQVICEDVSKVESRIAANYYKFPSKKLFTVGITGTNGKTTSAYLGRHIFEFCKKKCGLMGTVEYIVGDCHYPSLRTTLDVVLNQKILSDMVNGGCLAAVMEATSHGLDQNRLDDIYFDVALFTNITQDHFDYHKTFDHYFASKKKLLLHLKEGKVAIINKDDPHFATIIPNSIKESEFLQKDDIRYTAKLLSFAIEKEADLRAVALELSAEGTIFDLLYCGERTRISTTLIGRFNVYNILGAIGVALVFGLPLASIVEAIKTFTHVPGRMQRVNNDRGINIFVDFAHTETALINVLSTLDEIKGGRIITVFGCGGDRDRDKRPKMAKAVEKFSFLSIVTSDNPRTEDPAAIIKDIICGFSNPTSYIVEMDRAKAIERAIEIAQKGDILLIAGKGHEKIQIFKDKTIDFDDAEVVDKLVNR